MEQLEIQQIIDLDLAKNELKRLKIFIFILLIGLTIGVFNAFVFKKEIIELFGSILQYNWFAYWVFSFLGVCSVSLLYVKKIIRENKVLPFKYKLLNMIIETLFPGLLIFILIRSTGLVVFLDSPAFLIFFPIIILSALHQNFKLSFATGLIAAISYSLVVFWVQTNFSNESIEKLSLPIHIYFSKATMLLVSGFCAGIIGRTLRLSVFKSIQTLVAKNEIESQFSQQVSKPIMDALLKENGQSRRQEATILFLDIEDFSSVAQSRSPEEVILFQNNFFAPVIELINKNQGVVHQLMGDGLMASFGTPVEEDAHAELAYQASRDVFDLVAKNESFGFDDLEIKIRIGLHSGPVITGNIGSEHRKQYSISGTPIIIAARLEQLNKKLNSRFLISQETYGQLTSENIAVQNHGKILVKGIDEEVNVVEIKL